MVTGLSQSERRVLGLRDDVSRQPIGDVEDPGLVGRRCLYRAPRSRALVVDRGAHLEMASSLDNATQHEAARAEVVGHTQATFEDRRWRPRGP